MKIYHYTVDTNQWGQEETVNKHKPIRSGTEHEGRNKNKPMRTGMQLSFPIGIHSPRSIINDCLQCTVYDDMEHVITTALCLPSLGRVPPYCGTSTMGSFRTVAGGGRTLLQKSFWGTVWCEVYVTCRKLATVWCCKLYHYFVINCMRICSPITMPYCGPGGIISKRTC